MLKKKSIKIAWILLMAAFLMSLAACSQQSTNTQGMQQGAAQTNSNETTIYGKVTAVDGEKITLALGTMANGGNKNGEGPGGNGEPSGNMPSGNMPSGNGTPSGNMPSGGGQGGFGELTLTGESKTIEITDTGILKKFDMGSGRPSESAGTNSGTSGQQRSQRSMGTSSAALSDITVGSTLKVTYKTSDQKLLSVTIMGSGTAGAQSSPSASAQESTNS